VHYLKNNAWIPDRDGIFYSPQKISRLRLRHDFPYQNQNGLLDAIGLEDDIKKQTEDYQRKDLAAREFGFKGADEAHALALAVRETGMSEADAAAVIRQNGQKPELPVEDVRNPEKRRRGVREGGANAPTSEAVRKERSSQPNIPKVIAEAKAYLRAKYTNPHGQMSCQACQREMPFKLDDGNYYFEAVQVVERLAQHFFQNRLALCPTCAAMYKFARSCSDEELTKQISSSVVAAGGAVELPIGLASESRVLRFVATHFFDLQTVLSSPTEVAGDRTDVPPSSVADLFRVRR
jgi:hypothetical protein